MKERTKVVLDYARITDLAMSLQDNAAYDNCMTNELVTRVLYTLNMIVYLSVQRDHPEFTREDSLVAIAEVLNSMRSGEVDIRITNIPKDLIDEAIRQSEEGKQ